MAVLRLTVRLPRESRFVQAAGGPSVAWGTSEYLLAQVVDVLSAANYQRGGGKGHRPKPIPRPSDARPKRARADESVSQDQIKNFFATRKAVADS